MFLVLYFSCTFNCFLFSGLFTSFTFFMLFNFLLISLSYRILKFLYQSKFRSKGLFFFATSSFLSTHLSTFLYQTFSSPFQNCGFSMSKALQNLILTMSQPRSFWCKNLNLLDKISSQKSCQFSSDDNKKYVTNFTANNTIASIIEHELILNWGF